MKNYEPLEILTAEQMRQADKNAIASGIAELDLIRAAGLGLAEEVLRLGLGEGGAKKAKANKKRLSKTGKAAKKKPAKENTGSVNTLVFCGKGNNGADAVVAAGHLAEAKHSVQLIFTSKKTELGAEIKKLAGSLNPKIKDVSFAPTLKKVQEALEECDLVIDGLLGTGITSPVKPKDTLGQIISAINETSAFKVAVDIPSGLSADDGELPDGVGVYFRADMTVSFFRPKLCHYLYPAADACGAVRIVDIGITPAHIPPKAVPYLANSPAHWQNAKPAPKDFELHKYNRGHLLIVAGAAMPGALVLSSTAAAKSGAGLVSVFAPVKQEGLYKSLLPANIVVRGKHSPSVDMLSDGLEDLAQEWKLQAALIGPGSGVSQQTASQTLQLLEQPLKLVLDADVFSSFADSNSREILLGASRNHYIKHKSYAIMTPHLGEFRRLFADICHKHGDSKLDMACAAAKEAQAIIILKGADTVIACPDGRAVINKAPNKGLAVGGSGDILAGLIVSKLAQGMSPLEASCCGVWLHSQAAKRLGDNFTPQELAQAIKHSRS